MSFKSNSTLKDVPHMEVRFPPVLSKAVFTLTQITFAPARKRTE